MDNSVPVVVIYHGGNGALAVARTLGRLGVPTYLVSQKEATPVSASRYWAKRFWWDFSAPHKETLQFLLDVAQRIGSRPILLTLADWAAVFIEDNAEALAASYIFSRGPAPVVRRLANKWQMFSAARQIGIPTPDTVLPRSRAEALEFSRRAGFPVIMKGADQFLPNGKFKAIVHSERDLLEQYDRAGESAEANLILQEYVPGDVESVWMCNAYFGAGSGCRAIFSGRKLRQVSSMGIASLAICQPNEAVEDQTKRFMQGVGYQGCVGIGYRYDARDGRYKVLDVNARVSGVFRLFRATNGMDVVRICYLDLTGQPTPSTAPSIGRKWMLEEDFGAALRLVRERKLTVGQWLRSLRGVKESHWFAADDPAPILVWFWNAIQWKMRSAVGRVRSLLQTVGVPKQAPKVAA